MPCRWVQAAVGCPHHAHVRDTASPAASPDVADFPCVLGVRVFGACVWCRYLADEAGKELIAPVHVSSGGHDDGDGPSADVMRVAVGVGNVGQAAKTGRIIHATETVREGNRASVRRLPLLLPLPLLLLMLLLFPISLRVLMPHAAVCCVVLLQVKHVCCSPLRDRRSGLVVGVLETVFSSDDNTSAAADLAAQSERISARNESWSGSFVPFLEVCRAAVPLTRVLDDASRVMCYS